MTLINRYTRKKFENVSKRLILVRYYLQDTVLYAHFHAEHQPGHQEKSENVS